MIKHIRDRDYPSVVALQEGKGFDAVYLGSELHDCYWLRWGKVTAGAGAAETGLLLSKALYSEPEVHDVEATVLAHRPAGDPEHKAWDTTASKMLVCRCVRACPSVCASVCVCVRVRVSM